MGRFTKAFVPASMRSTAESDYAQGAGATTTTNASEKPQVPAQVHTMQAQGESPRDEESQSEPTSYDEEKKLEPIRTISRVPGNPNYYEKNGLRTFGDGEDHETEHPMTVRRFMTLLAMAFLWTGSQIPLYLYGGIIPIIMADIGGSDRYVWILLGNLIPLATVTPFVGALSDLFGRRNLSLGATVILMVGNVVCATAHTMNIFIGGQVLCGTGAGVLELTALAATGEMVPTRKRGLYVGAIIISILPYSPSVLYAQLVSAHASWRYIGLWCGLWAFVGFALTAIFYFPPKRVNSTGLSKKEILRRIDYVGGFLSAGGLTMFLAGLTWAGDQYAWHSVHVIAPLTIGLVMMALFLVWEAFFVKYPMFPARLKTNPRALIVIVIVTFVSGANFFAVLLFWPSQYFFMYAGNDPVSVGIGSLPVGFCIIGGSVICSILITVLKGKVRMVMICACVIMTAGNGAMAAANLHNLDKIYVAVTFACLGVGSVIIPNQIIAAIICPDDLIATITALTISVRVIGGSIGYAAYYNVLRNRFTTYAYTYIVPAAVDGGIYDATEIYNIAYFIGANLKEELLKFKGVTPELYKKLIFAGQQTFAKAFPEVYYISIAFGGVAIIAACFLPDLSPFMDNHIAVNYH